MKFAPIVLVLALVVAGCVQPAATPTPAATAATTPTSTASAPVATPAATLIAATNTIEITAAGFSPSPLRIKVGDTVTWINRDTTGHWPASALHPTHKVYPGSDIAKCGTAEAANIFDACKGIAEGQSWSFKFTNNGTWGYHDHLNPSLFGKVVVESTQVTVSNKTVEATDCSVASIVIEGVYIASGMNGTSRVIIRNAGLLDNMQIISAQVFNRTGSNFSASSLPVTNFGKGNVTTLYFSPTGPPGGTVATACPGDFSRVLVYTNCGGIAAEDTRTPNCI